MQVAERYAAEVIAASSYLRFLRREPDRSLRLLTRKASPLEPADLAYLMVRVFESFTYAAMITGDEPDSARVGAAIAALLQVPPGA